MRPLIRALDHLASLDIAGLLYTEQADPWCTIELNRRVTDKRLGKFGFSYLGCGGTRIAYRRGNIVMKINHGHSRSGKNGALGACRVEVEKYQQYAPIVHEMFPNIVLAHSTLLSPNICLQEFADGIPCSDRVKLTFLVEAMKTCKAQIGDFFAGNVRDTGENLIIVDMAV